MKAQISGQVFIYIFSMIVASAVLIFGYVAITNLNKVNTELQMTRFTEKLREDLDSAKGFGTVRNEQSYKEIPQQIQNVCFAYIEKIYEPRSSMAARLSQIEDIQIRNSIESDQTAFSQNPPDTSSIKNVFLIPDAQKYWLHAENTGVKPETPNKYVRCFQVTNGRLQLRMTGCGNRVIVSSPTELQGTKHNGEGCSSNSECQSESYCDSTCKPVCS